MMKHLKKRNSRSSSKDKNKLDRKNNKERIRGEKWRRKLKNGHKSKNN